jgi:hydroxymethylglutaryl-CoA lyase
MKVSGWEAVFCSMQRIHLVECPRDAIQGWPHRINIEQKLAYYRTLMQVGFDTLDIGSFVSPHSVPQMADTPLVIRQLESEGWSEQGTRLLVIVANERGARDACSFASICDVGFPLSLSETFQRRNTGASIQSAWDRLHNIREITDSFGKRLVVYLSMGFGNPYGEDWSMERLVDFAGQLVDQLQIEVIALSDTVGTATPTTIRQAMERLVPMYPSISIGAHLHATTEDVWVKAKAALEGGCLRLDGAIMGIGGCPMAQNDLVGNLATETLVGGLEELGIWSVHDRGAWKEAQRLAAALFS